ncbi:MAG: hypothetical protein LUD29_00940 [Clostridia bacterium]|nr:hypothetical protein [Clostridia bacterium]
MTDEAEKRKQRIKDFVISCMQRTGKSPTYREIQKATGIASLSTVSVAVNALVEDGVFEFDGDSSWRALKVPEADRTGETQKVYVAGEVVCGMPTFGDDSIEASVLLPTSIFGEDEYYILRAHGDSMKNAGIREGDLLVVHPYRVAHDGSVVVAHIPGEGNTCKTLRIRYAGDVKNVFLRAENDEKLEDGSYRYPDIKVGDVGGIVISGVVSHVIHEFPKSGRM